jgi:hypothetical protein
MPWLLAWVGLSVALCLVFGAVVGKDYRKRK